MKNILLNQYEDFVSNKFISFDEKTYQLSGPIQMILVDELFDVLRALDKLSVSIL